MWDKRYAQSEYVYGLEPNVFFKETIDKLEPGKILLPAEGEGRNAVYAAVRGWDVVAFDSSVEAQKKALKLAKKNNVQIEYQQATYAQFQYKENTFDAIVLIFAHAPQRSQYHRNLLRFLKPGGILILEGFTKEQINKKTGGPQSVELLFSKEELLTDFQSLKNIRLEEKEVFLSEGMFHNGLASVIRLTGIK